MKWEKYFYTTFCDDNLHIKYWVILQSIKLRGEINGLGYKGLKIAYFNRNNPQKITLLIDKDRLPLYVEASEIKLRSVLSPNLLRDLKVTGSKSFDRASDYQQKLREALSPIQNDLIQVKADKSKNTPEERAIK